MKTVSKIKCCLFSTIAGSLFQISPVWAQGVPDPGKEIVIAMKSLFIIGIFLVGSVLDLIIMKLFFQNIDFVKNHKAKTFWCIWIIFLISLFSGASIVRIFTHHIIDQSFDIDIIETTITMVVILSPVYLYFYFKFKKKFKTANLLLRRIPVFSIFCYLIVSGFAKLANDDSFKAGFRAHTDITITVLVAVIFSLSLYILLQSLKKLDAPDKQFQDMLNALVILTFSLFVWPDIQLIYKIGLLTLLLSFFLLTTCKYNEETPGRTTWFFSIVAIFCLAMHINVVTTIDSFFFNGVWNWQFMCWLSLSVTLILTLKKASNWKKNFYHVALFTIAFSLCLMPVYLKSDKTKPNLKAFKLNPSKTSQNQLIFLTVPKKVPEILKNDRLILHLQINEVYNSFIDLGKEVWSHLKKEDYYWNSYYPSPMNPQCEFSLEKPFIKGKSLRNGVSFGIEEYIVDQDLKEELLRQKKLDKEVVFNVFALIDNQGIATVKGVELSNKAPQKKNDGSINMEFYKEPAFDRY